MKAKNKRSRSSLFAMLLLAVLWTFQIARAQDLMAQVLISDGNIKINQLATYRVSLFIITMDENPQFVAGTKFKFYLSDKVSLQTTQGAPTVVTLCRRYLSSSDTTSPYSQCSYNVAGRFIQITLASTHYFTDTYDFEIGFIKNPSIADPNGDSNFRVTIEDSSGNVQFDVLSSSPVIIYPGDINTATATPASLKVGDTCIYTFKFKVVDAQFGDSGIEITFPSDISVPVTLTTNDITIQVYDRTVMSGSAVQFSLVKQSTITLNNPFNSVALTPDATKFITVTIARVKNPNSMKESGTFMISTFDGTTKSPISLVASGVTVKPTLPGEIILSANVETPKATFSIVGSTSSIQFDVQLPFKYDEGGYLLVTFPTESKLGSTLTCSLNFGFTIDSTLKCTMVTSSPQVVKIPHKLSASLSTRIIFLIGPAVNPSTNKPTSTFQLQAFDKENYLISQKLSGMSYTATPATIGSVTAVRSKTEVGQQLGNTLTLGFTAPSALQNGERIYLKIPLDQMIVGTSGTIACRTKTGSLPLSTVDCTLDSVSNSNYNIIHMPAPCTTFCSAGTVYSIELSGIRNPEWIIPTQTRSIEIQTMTSDLLWLKDRRLTGIFTTPDLVEGPISTRGISKTNNIVNSNIEMTLTLKLYNRIQPNGLIRVFFPQGGFFNPKTGTITCADSSAPSLTLTCTSVLYTDILKGIQYITIQGRCPLATSCIASQSITIKITNLRNRPSVKAFTNYFEIRTYTAEEYKIDLAQMTNEVDNLALTNSQYISLKRPLPVIPILTGALETYQFLMISQNGVYPNGLSKHEIFFPSDIKFSSLPAGQSPTCSATCSNSNLNCLISQNEKKLMITNNDPIKTFEDQEITITLPSYARNPQTTKPSGTFKIQTMLLDTEDQQYYLQDKDESMKVTADTPNSLQSVTVTRNDELINAVAEFTVTFTTFNPIPFDSFIQIAFPKDQIAFSVGQTRAFIEVNSGTILTPVTVTGDGDSAATHVTYTFKEWCSNMATECAGGTILSIKLTGVTNPPSTRLPKNFFKIIITTVDGYFTDQILTGVQALPLLSAGPFKTVTFSETNSIVGELSTIQVDVQLNNPITDGNSGKFRILFPVEMYYPSITETKILECFSDNIATDCTPLNAEGTLGTYIASIDINLECDKKSCAKDALRSFKVNNLRNRFSAKTLSGSLTVSTLDDEQYAFDSSSTLLSKTSLQTKLSTGTLATFTSATRLVKYTATATDLTMVLTINVRVARGSIIQVFVPKDQFEVDSASILKCSNAFNGDRVTCTFLSNNDLTYSGIQLKEFCMTGTILPYCPENFQFQLKVQGMKNRYNTKSGTTKFYFKTFTSEMDDIEFSQNAVLPANDLVPVVGTVDSNYQLSNSNVGGITSMTISYNLMNRISANDMMILSFDAPIFRKSASSVTCAVGFTGVTAQSATCSSSIDGETIKSVEIQLRSGITNPNTAIIQISNFMNLLEDLPHSTKISISAYTKDGPSTYGISTGTMTITGKDILKPAPYSAFSIIRSQKDLGKQATVTATFQSSFLILQHSTIKVSIPKSQLNRDVATNLECLFQAVSIQCTIVSENTTYYNLVTTTSFCLNSVCPADQELSFKFTGFKNPDFMMNVNYPIALDIISERGNGILRQEIAIKPDLQLGEINDFKVVQSGNLSTGSPTSFNVSWRFDLKLPSTYRVFIKFPQKTILPPQDGETPELACYDWKTTKKFNCIVNQRVDGYITIIAIENFCTIATCDPSVTQFINITNINNVDFVRPRSENIAILEVMPQGYITSQGFFNETGLGSLQPINLTYVNITRSATRPGASNVELVLSFKTPLKIPNRSYITYIIPREQQILPQFSRIVCASADQGGDTDLDCDTEVRNSTHVILRVQEWCINDCAKGSTIAMKISKSTNPQSLTANDPKESIGIYVETPLGQGIEQVLSDVVIQPLLDEVSMLDVFLMREKNILGADDNITVSMQVPPNLPSDVRISFAMPFNTTFPPIFVPQRCLLLRNKKWEQMTCTYYPYANPEVFGLKSLQNITVLNLCTAANPCKEGDVYLISLQISNQRSQIVVGDPLNAAQIEPYRIMLSTEKFDLGQTKIPYNITIMENGVISANIKNNTGLACQRTGQLCPLSMDIVTQNPFSGNLFTSLLVTLPQEMIIPQGASCIAKLLTKTMNCRFMTDRQIQVRHSLILTQKEYAQMNYGFRINLTVSQVQYPQTTEETGLFKLTTQETWNRTQLQIDEQQANITFRVTTPNPFPIMRANRTQLDPNTRTNLIMDISTGVALPKEAFLILQIPSSQLVLDFSITQKPLCYKGATLTGAQMLKCSIIAENTIELRDICLPNGCSNNTKIIFGIASTILYNPEFEADVIDSIADSIKVTTMVNSTRTKGQAFVIESTQRNVFVQPKMSILETLRITDAKLNSSEAYDLQKLSFKAIYFTKTFSRDYVRVKFYFTNFTEDPFYPIQATVNQVQTNITNVKLTQTGDIDYLIFECKQGSCKEKNELNIEIKGFRNPSFKLFNQTNRPRIQFGELVQRPERMYTSNSTALDQTLDGLQFVQLVNADTKFTNYATSASNNSLELLFSLENNPQLNQASQLSVKLPTGFSVPANLTCLHLFTNVSLPCNSSNGTVIITNTFKSAQQQLKRRMLQNSSSLVESGASNAVVAVRIMNITNPGLSQVNSSLAISITSGSLVYSLDNKTTAVSAIRLTSEGCADSNCGQCSVLDPRMCVACKSPSLAPIRQGYLCKERCDPGFFEFNKQCYRCTIDCKECQTYDQCLSCNNTVQVLIDGQCLDRVSKYLQVLQCPDGSQSSTIYGCFRNSSCSSQDCSLCGADSSFCLQCKQGLVALNGKCISECPSAYTSNSRQQCVKCDSSCGECSKSSKKCSSCQLDFYDSFKLDTIKNKCIATCQDGSILRGNDPKYCDACHPSCFTCSNKKTQCTSCYYHRETYKDLFLLDGQCVEDCPGGYYQNFRTHKCDDTEFQPGSAGPLFLIFTILGSSVIILASHIRTGKKDVTSNVTLFFLTQIEFLNRIILLACLWKTTQVFSFTVTGMNLLGNALFGIYFATNVVQPLSTQIKLSVFQTRPFTFLVVLAQFSGPNTLRLSTSRFFLLPACSLPSQYATLPYYLRHLETLNLLSLALTVCQFFVGVGCLLTHPRDSAPFAFALNAMIFNAALFAFQWAKYRKYTRFMREYAKIDQDPSNTNNNTVHRNQTVVTRSHQSQGTVMTSQGESESRAGSAGGHQMRRSQQPQSR